METFPALRVFCSGNSPATGDFPAQRPVTQSFDVFFLCARIIGGVNNREAGDLRRIRDHYDVTVMTSLGSLFFINVLQANGIMIFRSLFLMYNNSFVIATVFKDSK